MRRVTVTLPDELERDINSYLSTQSTPPTLTAVMQVALRDFLRSQRRREREYRAGNFRLRLPKAERGSGKSDLSVNHDKYLVED
ncbi:MAG: hypothetical protein WD273_14675 [Trueperaceae bacterium]